MRVTRDDALKQAFGKRLETARRHYGSRVGKPHITRTDFAKLMGLDRARYGRYERGETEPPLRVLEAIRRTGGISLDWLITGLQVGEQPNSVTRQISVGDRLRWARETQEPWLNACAAVMGVNAPTWQSYEEDTVALPVDKAVEFAHRFSVTLDYLYRGSLDGVAEAVVEALLRAHPELAPAAPQPPATNPYPLPTNPPLTNPPLTIARPTASPTVSNASETSTDSGDSGVGSEDDSWTAADISNGDD
jgi:transcriptional regulator with XRE-family HTH domain